MCSTLRNICLERHATLSSMTRSISLSFCQPNKRSTKTKQPILSRSTILPSISRNWFLTKWESTLLISKEKQLPRELSFARAPSSASILSLKLVNSLASSTKVDVLSLRMTASEYGSDSSLQNLKEIVPSLHTERSWSTDQLLLLLEITQNHTKRSSKKRNTSLKWDISLEEKPLPLEARPKFFYTAD